MYAFAQVLHVTAYITFLDLHEPGAQGTENPLTSKDLLESMRLQHMQFEQLLHGTVQPLFFPSAIDFRTDSFDPTFEAVFLTNLNKGQMNF